MDLEAGRTGSSSTPDFRTSVGTSHTTLDSNVPRQRVPRSLPPWIQSYEADNAPITPDQIKLLPPPQRTVLPQHNNTPSEPERRISQDGYVEWDRDPLTGRGSAQKRLSFPALFKGARGQQGRKWDHLRTAEPVVVASYGSQNPGPAAAWRQFLQSSVYGPSQGEESEVVDPEVLDKLQPDFNRPFENPLHPHDSRAHVRARRRTLWERIWRIILRHPLVPLVFRLIVMVTSLMSLAIAARIFRHEDREDENSAERTQSLVGIVVDTLSVPYIGYMLWDEYTGKPLGLRRATQKIALILLDLFFIIFKSASTALAFESLVYHNERGDPVVPRLSRTLAACTFVGLLAWTMNFMVNIFRTVARLGPGDS